VQTELRISEIWIYPIKSLGGLQLSSSNVLQKGLEFDRRYMLVDDAGNFITQRKLHVLSLFKLEPGDGYFKVKYLNESRSIPLEPVIETDPVNVTIWNDTVLAHEVPGDISKWFSDNLGLACKLVFFPETYPRPVEKEYQQQNEQVSLADAYPILIIGQSSLDDLNSRLETPVPMNRFRPNLVFSGGEAFCEDGWHDFRVGTANLRAVKSCARCILPTIDQETGEAGTEPIRTLSSYRRKNNKIYFGQNVLVRDATEIRTGDVIFIESFR
jgi:uncharacterized protein